jgi:hypothetical protein
LEFQEAVNQSKKAVFVRENRILFSKPWDPLIHHSITSQQTTLFSNVAVRTQIPFLPYK